MHSIVDTVSSLGYYDWKIDPDLIPASDYKIRVTSVNADSIFDISNESFTLMDTTQAPPSGIFDSQSENHLYQNYPNPFSVTTQIQYYLKKESLVSLKVYDSSGRALKTLVNANLPSGQHRVPFNASDLSNGIYFFQLRTSSFSQVRKMILIK